MTAIIDYGVGNLFSLKSSFGAVGAEAEVTGDPERVAAADRIILPGVGAFGDAARKLREMGLDKVLTEEAAKGKPLLGICLGMQLLFEKSHEYGEHTGLGLIPGKVVPIPEGVKIPHIGWNSLSFNKSSPLFKYIKDGDHAYFVHSYYAACPDGFVSAYTEYGMRLTASVERENVFGCQFHPEKSGEVGLNILRAFCEV
ncbi:MAG: imidazole glycerol phosphate synthase subunit HisH [Oscillospiraceae bacterium]|nr:imidazole glycerol phosphate synthase subunit HisH [Oscillospiraceae bacterium]